MGLSVTVLGASGSYPGPGGACSGYLIRNDETAVVVDLGTGSLANLQRHIGLDTVDAVVLSHAHPDHWIDLAGLRVALHYAYQREGLPVYGTNQNRQVATAVMEHLEPTFDWRTTGDGDVFQVGGLRFSLSRTDHYVETHAVRVDDADSGLSLAYSADTGPDWSFRSLGPDLDLALCESTFPNDQMGEGVLHLNATQAGQMARDGGVRSLVLTHLWPGTDRDEHLHNGREAFGGPVRVATDNERFDL